ncbi:hypothetical protein GQ600_18434 [Phytophthora cactorum]|nr:hypothetical protein GQ600_18434 [Phytophthora cactorum]
MAVTQATSRYTKTNAFVKKMDAYAETVKNREAKIAAVRDPQPKRYCQDCRRYELHVFVRIRSCIPADI